MSNVYRFKPDADRAVEASTWLAKLDRGLSPSEEANLKEWMQADKANEEELLSLARMWDKMDTLARLSDIFPRPASAGGPQRLIRPGWAVAVASLAGLALFAAVVLTSYERSGNLIPTADVATYETAVGEIASFDLREGSEITLNTNSRVVVQFDNDERTIRLKQGEIHIDVAQDASRPLRVIAGDRVVEAIGTAFSVRIKDTQRIEVLVSDGRVKVGDLTPRAADDRESTGAEFTRNSLLVSQGERLILDRTTVQLDKLDPEDLLVRLNWRNGDLIFRGESLGSAVAEVERYTPVEFIIEDEGLKKQRVAGLFKAGDITGFLDNLEANFDVTSRRVDDETILLSAGNEKENGPK